MFLTIDYDMLDIISVPYKSPIVTNGEWRLPVTKKNSFMMQDPLLAIKERASSIEFMKIKYHCLIKTSIPYSSTIVRSHVGIAGFLTKIVNL